HSGQRPMGEGPVSDLAPSGGAEALHLARREGREVVVEHEGAVDVALEGFDLLLVVLGAEGCRHQRLSLAAGEKGGTVGAGEIADFRPDGAHVLDATSVDTDPLLHDETTDLGLLHLLEVLLSLASGGGVVRHVVHRDEVRPGRLKGGGEGLGRACFWWMASASTTRGVAICRTLS